jgi:hypothetical protein
MVVPGASGGRTARKDGGLVNDLQNRNIKDANEDRPGKKHVGGMKSGGSIKSAAEEMVKNVKKAMPAVVAKKPATAMGRAGKAGGGTLTPDAPLKMNGTLPPDAPLPRIKPLQEQVTDVATKRASGGKADMDHDKDCKCKACSGGRMMRKSGGRTNINIIISPKGGEEARKPEMMPPMPPAPPISAPPPMGMPAGLGGSGMPQRPPMPMPMPGAPGAPIMARKDGGKVYPIKTGSGGGEARLGKKAAYGLKQGHDLKK